jgi:hypothetical protein
MKDENYVNIQGWMLRDDLTLTDSFMWGLIYGFSQDGESEFHGSISYIMSAAKVSKNTAIRSVRKLMEIGVVFKTRESHYRAIKSTIPKMGTVPKIGIDCTQNGYSTVPKSEHNNYTTNINNNNTTKSVNFEQKHRDRFDDFHRVYKVLLNGFQGRIGSADREWENFIKKHTPSDELFDDIAKGFVNYAKLHKKHYEEWDQTKPQDNPLRFIKMFKTFINQSGWEDYIN